MKFLTETIETPRLCLRRPRYGDAEELFANWSSDERTTEYLTWEAHTSVEETSVFINSWLRGIDSASLCRWVVVEKSSGELIGTFSAVRESFFSPAIEVGYSYGSRFWGQGYATEALCAVIRYIFENNMTKCIVSMHMEENVGSGRVMQKAGMSFARILKNRTIGDVRVRKVNIVEYSLTRSQYEAQMKAEEKPR